VYMPKHYLFSLVTILEFLINSFTISQSYVMMDGLSQFGDHPYTPTIFNNIICLCPNHEPNQIVSPLPSHTNTPKNINTTTNKEITSCTICFKRKQREELPTNSKNVIKKIYKAIHSQLFKMKKHEDDECLWKKTILMGERCQPLVFSGAIYYDSEGNQISEPPSTPPKSSPLSSFSQSLS